MREYMREGEEGGEGREKRGQIKTRRCVRCEQMRVKNLSDSRRRHDFLIRKTDIPLSININLRHLYVPSRRWTPDNRGRHRADDGRSRGNTFTVKARSIKRK